MAIIVPLDTVVVGASVILTESSENEEQTIPTPQSQQSKLNENTQNPSETSNDLSTVDSAN